MAFAASNLLPKGWSRPCVTRVPDVSARSYQQAVMPSVTGTAKDAVNFLTLLQSLKVSKLS